MAHESLDLAEIAHRAVAAAGELPLDDIESLGQHGHGPKISERCLLQRVGTGGLHHDGLREHHAIRLLAHEAGVELAKREDHVAEAAHRVQLAVADAVAVVVERLLDILIAAVLLEQELTFRRILLGDEERVGAVELPHPTMENGDVLEHGVDEDVVVFHLLLDAGGVAYLTDRCLLGGAANGILDGLDVPTKCGSNLFVLDVVVKLRDQHVLAGDGPRRLFGRDRDLAGDKELVEGSDFKPPVLVVGGVVDAYTMGVEQINEALRVGREAPPFTNGAAEFGGDDARVAKALGGFAAFDLNGHELLRREDDVVAAGVRLGDEILHHQGVEVGTAALAGCEQRGLVERWRTVFAGLQAGPHVGTALVIEDRLPIHRSDRVRAGEP